MSTSLCPAINCLARDEKIVHETSKQLGSNIFEDLQLGWSCTQLGPHLNFLFIEMFMILFLLRGLGPYICEEFFKFAKLIHFLRILHTKMIT